jgi:tripartite-type tricarboxylate transporter receptor subunit TctC
MPAIPHPLARYRRRSPLKKQPFCSSEVRNCCASGILRAQERFSSEPPKVTMARRLTRLRQLMTQPFFDASGLEVYRQIPPWRVFGTRKPPSWASRPFRMARAKVETGAAENMTMWAVLRTIWFLGLAVFCFSIAPVNAQTQRYPSRAITVVVPFPPAGASDVVARIVTEHMSRTLGQQLVIENVAGAGGTLGSARVAAAAPDGYTLLAGSMGSHVAAPVLTPNLKYDPARDFAAIGLTANSAAVIAARKDFPAKDLKEFVSYLKENGDRVKQAHGGIGASSHMACLLFTSELGVKPIQVAYRGTGPAINDLVGGHVDFSASNRSALPSRSGLGWSRAMLFRLPNG